MAVDTYLISYWDLDEGEGVRYDSKSTNHLTDNGPSGYAVDAIFDYVASFDPPEHLAHADNAELSVGDIDFCVAGWFYLKDKDTSQGLAAQYTTSGNQRAWQLAYVLGTDQFEAIFSDDGESSVIILEDTVLGSPSAGTWYFIVLWHDATANTVNMQINNGSISSESWSLGVKDSTGDFTIGGVNGGGSDSKISRFGFWKNGLLSAAEKTWLYNSGAGRSYDEIDPDGADDLLTNLISHWRLNNSLADAHGSYDLTNNNSVGFVDAGLIRNSGEFLQAASFVNVANSYLSRADNADLSTGDNDFVLAAWVSKINLTDTLILLQKDDNSTEREYSLVYSSVQSAFRITLYDSDENAVAVNAVSLGVPTEEAWYFLIAWYDSTAGTLNIQIGDQQTNGLLPLNAVFTGSIVPSDTTSDFNIGGAVSVGWANIQGVSFWKGGLLSQSEKLALYNNGFGLDYPWTGSPFLANETGVYSFGKGGAVDENQTGSHTALNSLDISGTRYQVAGFWNEDDNLAIAWREMGGSWTTYVQSGISVDDDDRHDAVSVGLDTSGYVHVAYGMHNDALKYAISNAALPSWTGTLTTGQTFTGSNESSVTYPFLFNDPTGKLYVRYRDGVAASGDWYLKSNTAGSSTWAGVTGAGTDGIIVNGKTSTDAVYGSQPTFSDDFNGAGTGEMFFVGQWNKGGTYYEDIFFAAWDGTSWTQSDGTSQTMPVTAANCDTIVTIANTVEQGLGGLTYDSQNRPHLIYYEADGSGDLQMKHAYYDSGWTLYAVTDVASSSFQPGETFARGDVIYTFFKDYTQDNLIRLKKSGSDVYTSWSDKVLYSESLHDPADTDTLAVFHYDRDYYRASGTIHLLLQPWWINLGQKPISLLEWALYQPRSPVISVSSLGVITV